MCINILIYQLDECVKNVNELSWKNFEHSRKVLLISCSSISRKWNQHLLACTVLIFRKSNQLFSHSLCIVYLQIEIKTNSCVKLNIVSTSTMNWFVSIGENDQQFNGLAIKLHVQCTLYRPKCKQCSLSSCFERNNTLSRSEMHQQYKITIK